MLSIWSRAEAPVRANASDKVEQSETNRRPSTVRKGSCCGLISMRPGRSRQIKRSPGDERVTVASWSSVKHKRPCPGSTGRRLLQILGTIRRPFSALSYSSMITTAGALQESFKYFSLYIANYASRSRIFFSFQFDSEAAFVNLRNFSDVVNWFL